MAGTALKNALNGLFGFGGLVLPFAAIIAAMRIFFQKETVRSHRAHWAVLFFITITALAHVFGPDARPELPAAERVSYAYKIGGVTNGGVLGALAGDAFLSLFDNLGAKLFLILLLLVFFTLTTGAAVFTFLRTSLVSLLEYLRMAGEYDDYEDEEPGGRPETRPRRRPGPLPLAGQKKARPAAKTFVIDDDATTRDSDERIDLINEKLPPYRDRNFRHPASPSKNPKVVMLNEHKNKNISEIITLQSDEELAGTPAGELNIKLNGFVEGLAPDPAPEEDYAECEDDEYRDERGEVFVRTAGAGREEYDLETGPAPGTPEFGYSEYIEDDYDTYDEQDPPASRPLPAFPPRPAPFSPGAGASGRPAPSSKKGSAMPSIPSPKINDNLAQEYIFPSLELLNKNSAAVSPSSKAEILRNAEKLVETLKSFGVEARVSEVTRGPAITRYELVPGQGVKVSKISGLADDLALNLAAQAIRIEAPIPGKAAVGIEIPNAEVSPVYLRDVIEDGAFQGYPSKLAFALGKDIAGNPVVADIAKMPHLLIAGATGSGKSVCINTIITSIIYKANPEEVKLIMVDPKVVELSVYNGIPHLLIPVVTEPKKAAGALNWAVQEMVGRYNLFAETGTRNLKDYNEALAKLGETNFLPQIVIIIDELADLMMTVAGEVEDAICRLAQMARAAGLHLIIATQRPSVDVITGLIKTNIPSRLAFAVSSGTDSRTILDMVGAERLLGKGDMLFSPMGTSKPRRIQGAFITDKEVEKIVDFVKRDAPEYDTAIINKITAAKSAAEPDEEQDEFFSEAAEFVIKKEKASASMLQRQFRIGYNRASRLIEDFEKRGIVGPEDGAKPRKVLMSLYQWNEYKGGEDA
ncbi:MAG: DNA translocase FtsK [Clostridiales bacterium]|nr:DNA translocase FtsK [Clostridiales bacterium]